MKTLSKHSVARHPTMKDIAEVTGVNQSTVSRVLNNVDNCIIREDTRAKILQKAHDLNYEFGMPARTLVSGKSFVITGILASPEQDLGSPIGGLVLAGLIEAIGKHGYIFAVMPVHNRKHADVEVQRAMRSLRADGVFLGRAIVKPSTLRKLAEFNIPLVTTDRSDQWGKSGASFVWTDEMPGACALVDALRHYGHQKIAYFMPDAPHPVASRHEAFVVALREAKMPPCETIKYACTSHSFMMTQIQARESALNQVDRIRQYTAIVCSSDLAALGLIDALRENGIQPGKDISVVGYDNLETNPNYPVKSPFLATIDKNYRTLGSTLGETLIRRIKNPQTDSEVQYVASTFIQRASLGPCQDS